MFFTFIVVCRSHTMDLHPGPFDDSVLTLQDRHRSTGIWSGAELPPLVVRRSTGRLTRFGVVDDRIVAYLRRVGLYGIYRIGHLQIDHALIIALIDRWRQETHTFHLPVGETTITLQDVSIITGLPLHGRPITGAADTHHLVD